MNSLLLTLSRKLRALCIGGLMLSVLVGVQAQTDAPGYLFTHLAGPLGGPGNVDGPAPDARFNQANAVTVDRAGNVYVADYGNGTLRKITPAGVVSTVRDGTGTPVPFTSPTSIAVDNAGNLYAADPDGDRIFKLTPDGVASVFAGASSTHLTSYGGRLDTYIITGESRDGTGADARFFRPTGVATDNANNVYVADSLNQSIRKITPDGVVTTLAGPSPNGYVTTHLDLSLSTDGTGTSARFVLPNAVTVDRAGNVYVADSGKNHGINYGYNVLYYGNPVGVPSGCTVRKITPDGVVTTLAGSSDSGYKDGAGMAALFDAVNGLAADNTGNLYLADSGNNTIRRITPDGTVTTVAGKAGQPGFADGTGTSAQFNAPTGVALDSTGNLYVADPQNFTIRRITPTGAVSTFAAQPGGFGATDGTGVTARLNQPFGLALDNAGNVFVADHWNSSVRKITPDGGVTTLAGADGKIVQFGAACGVAVDSTGNVFVACASTNAILKLTPVGKLSTFAGPPDDPVIFGHADGPGATATFAYPAGLTIDRADTLYVSDSANNTIRKITPDGVVTTLAGTAGVRGSADGTGANAQFSSPFGLAVDSSGTVYVADSVNNTIRKISPSGVVTTLAGAAQQIGSTDGIGSAARFNYPNGIAVDSAGNVLVGDTNNHLIRRITPGGEVTTVGGKTGVLGTTDGIGSAARFFNPDGLAVDNAGTLYVAEQYNHAIRKGQLAGPPVITSQPQSQTVAPGNSVQFLVTASAVPAPTYQWYFNGGLFNGATTSTLSFANARSADAGDYTVVVTNQLGAVTSTKATLTVSAAPVTPPATSTPSPGGGGAIDVRFALALLTLVGARHFAGSRIS